MQVHHVAAHAFGNNPTNPTNPTNPNNRYGETLVASQPATLSLTYAPTPTTNLSKIQY
jgi:hypothetical protein